MTPDPRCSQRSAAANAGGQQPANPMDKLAVEYDRWFDSPKGKELFEIELACVREVTGDARGRWLEVGVGTGRFGSALGIREGIDPSEPALRLARSRGIDAQQGTAEKLPYADGVFDGVLFVTTLCFVADAHLAMRESRRVLKPGGELVIGMIPGDSPWGKLYAEKGRQGHRFYATAHFHTASEVISLAEKARFTFHRAWSCLLSPPESPPTNAIEPGISKDAGFVSLGFSAE